MEWMGGIKGGNLRYWNREAGVVLEDKPDHDEGGRYWNWVGGYEERSDIDGFRRASKIGTSIMSHEMESCFRRDQTHSKWRTVY